MRQALIILLLSGPTMLFAQSTEQIIRNGNELYRKGDLASAEKEYDKVTTDPRAVFNKGNALYKQDKKSEAQKVYASSTTPETEISIRSRSYYNKGVVLSSEKKLEESIEAYKNVLRLDPNDKEARENLQKALLELKKKSPKKNEPKKNPPKKQPPQPKMNKKQTEQKLKQLEQKEKQTQQKIQQKRPVGVAPKDW